MSKKYTADSFEDDLNHDPIYQAGLKHLKDLADKAGGVIEGHFTETTKPADNLTEAIEDMKYLSWVEGYMDNGGQVTQEIYKKCYEIEQRNRKKAGY